MPAAQNKFGGGVEIRQVPIGKISPDKNQPRTNLDPGVVADMAKSIGAQGLINPIEIDKDFVIVTGHVRYEAAKKAGLKTVPCREVNPENANVRFQRQVIENLQQNSMTGPDIAKALAHMLSLITPVKDKKGSGGHNDKGITELAHAIGKSESYVHEKLDLLDLMKTSPHLKKAIAKGLPSSYARALKDIPEDFKEQMEEKIIAEEFKSKESALAVRKALIKHPNEGVEIMNVDYTGLDEFEVNSKIRAIIPGYSITPEPNPLNTALEPSEKICHASQALIHLLANHTMADVGEFNVARVVLNLRRVQRHLADWLNSQDEGEESTVADEQPKLLEGDADEE